MADEVDQILRDFQIEVERATAVTIDRLRAINFSARDIDRGNDIARTNNPSRESNYQPGPEPAEWVHAQQAAGTLGVHYSTVWRWAEEHRAVWPYGKARRVDFSKLKYLRPDVDAQNAKNAQNTMCVSPAPSPRSSNGNSIIHDQNERLIDGPIRNNRTGRNRVP